MIPGCTEKLTNANGITIGSQNLGDTQVTDDDIFLLLDKTRQKISMNGAFRPGKSGQTHMPKLTSFAFLSLPMILVLLPTLTWSAVWVMVPLTNTTFLESPETAAVNAA